MDTPICQAQQARQLHASVLVDVDVEEELSLQFSDLLLGVRTTFLPPLTGLWEQDRQTEKRVGKLLDEYDNRQSLDSQTERHFKL